MQPTADAARVAAVRRYGPSAWPRPTATRRGRLLNLAVVTLAVAGGLAGLFITWYHLANDPLSDLRVYFDAATRLNEGRPLYPLDADPNTAYRYPPLLAVALRPVALVGYAGFAAFWEAVVVGSFVLLVRRLGARSRWTWLSIGIMGMPIGWCLAIGQAQVPMTLLLSIGQPWSLALAANLKLFPALAAIWWIGRREWRAATVFFVSIVVLAVVQIALEPNGSRSFPATLTFAGVEELVNLSPYALSPWLWGALVVLGGLATLRLAKTRWGWPAAVAFATLAIPRVLTYTLMSLLAAMREPQTPVHSASFRHTTVADRDTNAGSAAGPRLRGHEMRGPGRAGSAVHSRRGETRSGAMSSTSPNVPIMTRDGRREFLERRPLPKELGVALDPLAIRRARPPDAVSLPEQQQQLGEIRAVLAGDPGDERGALVGHSGEHRCGALGPTSSKLRGDDVR